MIHIEIWRRIAKLPLIKTEASIDAEGAELIEGDDPEDALESLHSIDAQQTFMLQWVSSSRISSSMMISPKMTLILVLYSRNGFEE